MICYISQYITIQMLRGRHVERTTEDSEIGRFTERMEFFFFFSCVFGSWCERVGERSEQFEIHWRGSLSQTECDIKKVLSLRG